ncbi:ABC transporter G family member 14 isoform X1 [Belonocnema kinseyi]|nr:ABC transporter G family member 14 isoform X1 [Belonocnema kinseyi]XP_033228210.1 ABC transporter G family member 14 isoform X1 [Belonocnema kinseyi]XP_033228211.1 ABC transporter G family member 14 isoform X1 [Belonocnema kinseyi]XP_033228212.1 ABC transporter G family member 14 isoform X1 [Belonocnema kinseyi]XP_033228213.1 ABC transporter G family member 14 isoform X1 [Belonocnema kinseyi]XP_033228214.1 ABC transporter G family member 14 isoform X1 [Belonocnema kinseyi]XP_033228215.1 AB
MIISKDLFLLGDQDYLRLPDSEKRHQRAMGRPIISASRVESSALQLVCPLDSRPIQLVFRGLQVVKEKRSLLRDVSGVVKPGELLAVMGPSGCGKTTLLNCLSGRVGIDSGEIWLNRERLTKRLRRRICYVQQQDIFFSDLTLRQTLEYQARLRLPDMLSYTQKMQCVDHIIKVLDLVACQDTIIGDYSKRGLSGGEKKRTSIACELLTNPSLMLLDEPTSGLDSHSAQALIIRLKKYAEQEGKSIVVTVHQPSSRMFHSFSKLLLLSRGQVAYYGFTANIGRFFSNIGLALLPHYNPADFILEQIKGPEEVRERIVSAARAMKQGQDCPLELRPEYNPSQQPFCDHFIQYHDHHHHHHITRNAAKDEEGHTLWLDTQSHASSTASDDDYIWQWPTSFWSQFKVLSERNFQDARPRMLSRLNWLQTIALGLLAGLLWLKLPRTEEALHDIQGWMFFSTTYWMLFAHFGALSSFPPERQVINKERLSGSYRLSAYYLAKMCGELPLTITLPAVYHLISYPMLGFHSPAVFITLLAFLLLNTVVAQSVGFFVGACCLDLQVSITASALYTLATQLLGGYLATAVPPWLSWARYASMVHYAYQNMQILEFGVGDPILCSQPSKFPECSNGTTIPLSAILERQGGVRGSGLPLWANTAILVTFLIVFRTLGYLVLRFYRVPQ